MNVVLLCGAALWLLVLTLVVSRVITLVTKLRDTAAAAEPVDEAGEPARRINGPLPAEVAAAFDRLGTGRDLSAAAFTAGHAPSVRQALLVEPDDVDPGRTVFLVTGGDGGDLLHEALASTGALVVHDPEAGEIVRGLGISTPLAFEVSAGEVVAQFHLGRDGTFGRFSELIRAHLARAGSS